MKSRDEDLVYEHVDGTAGSEPEREGERIEPEPGALDVVPEYALRPEVVFALRKGEDWPGGVFKDETGRTISRQNCNLDAHFGVVLTNQAGTEVGRERFSALQPELRLMSQGHFGIRIGVSRAENMPGHLSVVVRRDPAGEPAPEGREVDATSLAQLNQQLVSGHEIALLPPAALNGSNNRVVVETITATVTWTTAAGGVCSFLETLNVRWEFGNREQTFRWWPPGAASSGSTRARVAHGQSLREYPEPGGGTLIGVPIQTFFPVADFNRCCQGAGRHTVIQFVRHEWKLLENPSVEGGDAWSLDVSQSELDRANASPPEDYDPTFTHDPRGTDPNAAPLVYPGPDPNGDTAMGQVDRPGVSGELHRRLVAAGAGSEFVFHFMSLLLCQLQPSSAAAYMASGKVEQLVEYRLKLVYRGAGNEPLVSLEPVGVNVFSPCKELGALLRSLDRQGPRRGQGSLDRGYRTPRGHSVGIPTGH